MVFGAGSSKELDGELTALGIASRGEILLVCTPGRAKDAADFGVAVYPDAKEHVPRETVDDARRHAEGKTAVIALGGGSAIGLAKALALEAPPSTPLAIIAIPTTYSGSEMTPVHGITSGGEKKTGRDERVRARLVIYDSDLFTTLPRATATASLWNALAHAVEASWVDPNDRATHALANEARVLLTNSLRRVGASAPYFGDDALEGAYLAGAAFADAGSGIHHKLCHELGGKLGLPHALTHAAMLPHVVRFQEARGLVEMGLGDELTALAISTGMPTSLEELGMKREDLSKFSTGREILEAAWPKRIAPSGGKMREKAMLRGPEKTVGASGFGGAHESEALPGAVPRIQNAPRHCPYGLVPELVNGMPFTVKNVENSRIWFYRVRASFDHSSFETLPHASFLSPLEGVTPNRTRWREMPIPDANERVDFIDGLATLGGSGDVLTNANGFLIHMYSANADMEDRSFSSADGDLLLVPQSGTLECRTECGWLRVPVGSIAVIPRGIKFAIGFAEGQGGRGWMLEVFGRRLRLPERGLIGSNGLADARHFFAPIASYEDRLCDFECVRKMGNELWRAKQKHSVFDVVGWHGTHVPFVYDMQHFSPMASAKFDHQDPSIFTVLTAPFDDHGRAICDFVVFPGRWDVLENSFRPPFAHRNAASEVNCVVKTPDPEHGYDPGVTFLSPLLTSHGVTTETYEQTWNQTDAEAEGPRRLPDESVWVMFESALHFRLSKWAKSTPLVDQHFGKLFEGMKPRFDPKKK